MTPLTAAQRLDAICWAIGHYKERRFSSFTLTVNVMLVGSDWQPIWAVGMP